LKMKSLQVVFAIISLSFGVAFADDKPFAYIHGSGDTCESSFVYEYILKSSTNDTNVKFTVNMFVRTETDHPNSLLFFFENYNVLENATPMEHPSRNTAVTAHPVRVTYDARGLITKVEFNSAESDNSYFLKKGIVSTMQLDWAAVQASLAKNSVAPDEFDTTITSNSVECKITTHIHRAADTSGVFIVHSARTPQACISNQNGENKNRQGQKHWRYHFDLNKTKNFENLFISIETPYKEDGTLNHTIELNWKGCGEIQTRQWTADWEELKKPIPRGGSKP